MSVKNLDAAKSLVKKYRSITSEYLKEVLENCEIGGVLERTTGFGRFRTCCLCSAIGRKFMIGECRTCIHYVSGLGESTPCIEHHTYSDIREAESIDELYTAVQKRADYIELLIKFVENGN